MSLGVIQDLTLETDSLEQFEHYLRLTAQLFRLRYVQRQGLGVGQPIWQYPSEAVWQEIDDDDSDLTYRSMYWLVCNLISERTEPIGDIEVGFPDEEELVREVIQMLTRSNKQQFYDTCANPFACAEGSSGLGYRLHVSGYSGVTVCLCRIYYSK